VFTIIERLIDNWKLIATIMALLVFLSMTGNLTITMRSAKEGLRQIFTPLGFMTALIIAILIMIIIDKIV